MKIEVALFEMADKNINVSGNPKQLEHFNVAVNNVSSKQSTVTEVKWDHFLTNEL